MLVSTSLCNKLFFIVQAYNQLQQKPKWLYKLDTELSRIAQKENCRFSSDVVVSMQFLGNSQDYICKVCVCVCVCVCEMQCLFVSKCVVFNVFRNFILLISSFVGTSV